MTTSPTLAIPSAGDLARDVLDSSAFWGHADCPFGGAAYEGHPRVALIVGENASGKSLYFRMIAARADVDHKMFPITISIRERTGAGSHEMGGMRKVFMFGNEQEQSTGATSYNVTRAGFHNARRDDVPSTILMLDEPEIGLSDGYAMALGEYIGQEALMLPETCAGVVVVTHNRGLARGLRRALDGPPTFIHLSDQKAMSFLEWLPHPEVRTVADLEGLSTIAGERRKATYQVLNAIKGERDD